MGQKLTKSAAMWLSDLDDEGWFTVAELADGRGVRPSGRGAVGKVFSRLADLGFAVLRFNAEAPALNAYRITDTGRRAWRAALSSAPKGWPGCRRTIAAAIRESDQP